MHSKPLHSPTLSSHSQLTSPSIQVLSRHTTSCPERYWSKGIDQLNLHGRLDLSRSLPEVVLHNSARRFSGVELVDSMFLVMSDSHRPSVLYLSVQCTLIWSNLPVSSISPYEHSEHPQEYVWPWYFWVVHKPFQPDTWFCSLHKEQPLNHYLPPGILR